MLDYYGRYGGGLNASAKEIWSQVLNEQTLYEKTGRVGDYSLYRI